jgi:hypothetical protein
MKSTPATGIAVRRRSAILFRTVLGHSRLKDVASRTAVWDSGRGGAGNALVEDWAAAGEWTCNEHDLWVRVFLRTVDKLYRVKE